MKFFIDLLDKQLTPCWQKPTGAAVLCVLLGVTTYTSLVLSGKSENSVVVICLSLAAPLLCGILWLTQNRLPKVTDGKVGVVIAVSSEDDVEAKQINEDFVSEVRGLLETDLACAQFQVLVLTGYWSRQARLDAKGATDVLTRMRGHIIFCGSSRQRVINGKPTHVLSLDTSLRHVPIPEAASRNLSKEMGESLPRKLFVPVDGDVVAFEATSQWVGMGAKFLAGIAAGLSHNYPYAEKLFLDVEHRLKTAGQNAAFLQPLARSVPNHLRLLYMAWVTELADRYYMKRDRKSLEESHPLCDKLLARDPNAYSVYQHKAISTFILFRDVAAARVLVAKSMKTMGGKDATAYYSLAFLAAYEGDLQRAHSHYRDAFKRIAFNPTVPIQSEEFIHLIMAEEPDKRYLVFCTGLINYNAKDDFAAAALDFEKFLGVQVAAATPWARGKAQELLSLCSGKAEQFAASSSSSAK